MNWDFIAGWVSGYLVTYLIIKARAWRKKVPLIFPLLPLVRPGEKWSMDCGKVTNKNSPWEGYEKNIITVIVQDVKEGYVKYYYGEKAYMYHVDSIREFTKFRYKTESAPIEEATES